MVVSGDDTEAEHDNWSPEILLKVINLNTRLPLHLDNPPWRLPSNHQLATQVNRLLGMNILYQKVQARNPNSFFRTKSAVPILHYSKNYWQSLS